MNFKTFSLIAAVILSGWFSILEAAAPADGAPPCYSKGADFCISDKTVYNGPDKFREEAELLARGARIVFENAMLYKRATDPTDRMDTLFFEEQVMENISRGLDQRWWRPAMSAEIISDDRGALKFRYVWKLDGKIISATDWIEISRIEDFSGGGSEKLLNSELNREALIYELANALWESYHLKNRRDIIDERNTRQLEAIEKALLGKKDGARQFEIFKKIWTVYDAGEHELEKKKLSAPSMNIFLPSDRRVPSDRNLRKEWLEKKYRNIACEIAEQELVILTEILEDAKKKERAERRTDELEKSIAELSELKRKYSGHQKSGASSPPLSTGHSTGVLCSDKKQQPVENRQRGVETTVSQTSSPETGPSSIDEIFDKALGF